MSIPQDQAPEDKKIRLKLFKKDQADVSNVKQVMEQEEKELKNFFQDMKQTTSEDPTIIRRQKYDEKMSAYRQAMEGLDLKNIISLFFSYEPPTPEEIETVNDCKRVTTLNFIKYASLGLTFTQGMNIYNRRIYPFSFKVFGVFVGIFGGGIFGIIRSTEYSLQRLENLGPDYSLGRLAIQEIEEFRMDKKIFQKDKQ